MDTYPRFSFRLSRQALQELEKLALVRNASKGQVIREAISYYFHVRTSATLQAVEDQDL